MKKTMIRSLAATALLVAAPLFAEEKAAVVTELQPVESVRAAEQAPKMDIDALLKLVPDVVATYGDNQKISGEPIKAILKFQLEMIAAQKAAVTQEELVSVLAPLVEEYAMQEVVAVEAEKQGFTGNADEIRKNLEELKSTKDGMARLEMFLKIFCCKNFDELVEKQTHMQAASMLLQHKMSSIAISAEQVKAFYDEHVNDVFTELSASHILIPFSAEDGMAKPTAEQEAAALKKIQEVQKKLADGGDFGALAKEYSSCPSKNQGGFLGKFGKGQMVPEFEAALLKLKPNQISEPVKTEFGYHLIKAGEMKVMSFDEVKTQIETMLKQEQSSDIIKAFVEQLRKDYNVKLLLPGAEIWFNEPLKGGEKDDLEKKQPELAE